MMALTSLIQFVACLATAPLPFAQAAPSSPLALKTREGGVGVLDIAIPPNRKDDRYYTVSNDSFNEEYTQLPKDFVLTMFSIGRHRLRRPEPARSVRYRFCRSIRGFDRMPHDR